MDASKTVSTCTPTTAQATHVFDIFGYSKLRKDYKFIRSGTFAVGGVEWSILFHPGAIIRNIEDDYYITVYLELFSHSTEVWASCDLRLVDQSTGLSYSVRKTDPISFHSCFSRHYSSSPFFKNRTELESSPFLRDDRLTIECVVTVIQDPQVSETRSIPKIEVPPSDITEHLGKLLEEQKGCDVSFDVGGETFKAHKCVLAMRSTVLKAELFGPMREGRSEQRIIIGDMQPDVFRALLHFIYTDSLLQSMDLEEVKNTEMIRHLLVAADIYAMERLKLVCQSILCENLNVETVATTLALADQHNCDMIKDACLEFVTCSNTIDAVVATQGYKDLKSSCPLVALDAFERARKLRKT